MWLRILELWLWKKPGHVLTVQDEYGTIFLEVDGFCRVRWGLLGAPDCALPVTEYHAEKLVKVYIPEEEHELLQLSVELLNAQ